MSKTYLNYLEKATILVEGIKKNQEELKNYGITPENVAKLEQAIKEGAVLNQEVEKLRAAASEKTGEANAKLVTVKDMMLEFKHVIKKNFYADKWQLYGVLDKR